jgi:hypothetical protein
MAIMVLLFVPIYGLQALPLEWKARLFGAFAALDITRLVVIAVASLAVLNAGLLAAAMTRFRRAQLILQ